MAVIPCRKSLILKVSISCVDTLDFDILGIQEGSCLPVLNTPAMYGIFFKNTNTDGRQYIFVIIYSLMK